MKLKTLIRDISQFNSGTSVNITHCLREANQVANFLTKLASSRGNKTFYSSHRQLPREAKGLIQLDKW
ncbi:hypothetical protein MTR67_036492 [Solanum verrucosum]|uniref:Uncharacterized protein n=1 Tax=Solanum verrucosum TaxID=315347 RepID=A0AAF0UBV8_SOLVR|nr:hypothetical protein MTR67_036492 [Solanum verrucosum]